jgi:hypothetical protein
MYSISLKSEARYSNANVSALQYAHANFEIFMNSSGSERVADFYERLRIIPNYGLKHLAKREYKGGSYTALDLFATNIGGSQHCVLFR